jgi:tryptophan 2,3-dioxygenase
VDKIIGAQKLRSEEVTGKPVHDEMMFIVVHQAYELWFKMILHDVGSVIELFRTVTRDDQISTAVHRLERVIEIMKLLVHQVDLVEQITPLDFLDFRDYLIPASGFQSVQFRLFEIKLGLRSEDRNQYQRRTFLQYFKQEHQEMLTHAETETSLFEVIERWFVSALCRLGLGLISVWWRRLERTPFVEFGGFRWLDEYHRAVDAMLQRVRLRVSGTVPPRTRRRLTRSRQDERSITDNPVFTPEQRDSQLKELSLTRASFDTIFDARQHEELREKGHAACFCVFCFVCACLTRGPQPAPHDTPRAAGRAADQPVP